MAEESGGRGGSFRGGAAGQGSGGWKADRRGGGSLSDRWADAVGCHGGVTGSAFGSVVGEAGWGFVPSDAGCAAGDCSRSELVDALWSEAYGKGDCGEALVALAAGAFAGQHALARLGSPAPIGDGVDETMGPSDAGESVPTHPPAVGSGAHAVGKASSFYRALAEENRKKVEEILARNGEAGNTGGGSSMSEQLHTTVVVNMQDLSQSHFGGSATDRGADPYASAHDKTAPVVRPRGVRGNAAVTPALKNSSAWNQPRIVRFSKAEVKVWEQMPPDRAFMDEVAMEADFGGGAGDVQRMSPTDGHGGDSAPMGSPFAEWDCAPAPGYVSIIYRTMAEEYRTRVTKILSRNKAVDMEMCVDAAADMLHAAVDMGMQDCFLASLAESGNATGCGTVPFPPAHDKSSSVERPLGVCSILGRPGGPCG